MPKAIRGRGYLGPRAPARPPQNPQAHALANRPAGGYHQGTSPSDDIGRHPRLWARIGQTIGCSLDLDETARAVLEVALPDFAQITALWICGDDGVLSARGRLRAGSPPTSDVPPLEALGRPRDVLTDGVLMVVPGASTIAALGLESYILVPLVGRARVYGVLGLGQSTRAFGEDELALATQLGRRAGIALEHAFAFRRAEGALEISRLKATEEALRVEINERKRAEERQQLLLDELSHRVKNTLATVASIATQSLRSASSFDYFRESFVGRIRALGAAQSLLTQAKWERAMIGDVVWRALEPHLPDPESLVVDEGPSVPLNARTAQALLLVLHELATNAGKYGALTAADGVVTIRWMIEDDGPRRWIRLRWTESGGPAVTPPTRRGFGTTLVERSVRYELDGEARADFAPTGVRWDIRMLWIPVRMGSGDDPKE